MKYALILATLALSACASGTVTKERIVSLRTPVTMSCIVGDRPERPVQFVEQTPNWDTMDHKQRDAAAASWALDWVNYGLRLDAATAACTKASD